MRSIMKKAVLFAAAFLVLAGGTARASVVEVKVPFPFLVQHRTFPAGTYRVQRDETDGSVLLIRGEKAKQGGMFVLTAPASGRDPAGEKPALTFSHYENTYRLDDVWDAFGEGREVTEQR